MAKRLVALAFILMTLTAVAQARATFDPVTFAALAGWSDDDHEAALESLQPLLR